MGDFSKIEQLFKRNQGILGAKTLLENGVTYSTINSLLADAVLVKLKRGLYKWAAIETDEMVEVARMVPDGVFCLWSAAFFHELTTTVPTGYHLAIPDDRKATRPDYPPTQLYFWNKTPYTLGVTTAELAGGWIKVYDLEKTVCDVIRHRKKIGLEVLKEILNNYLQRKDRNLHRLQLYAQELNSFNKINDLIKILI